MAITTLTSGKYPDNVRLYFGTGNGPGEVGDTYIEHTGSAWNFSGAMVFGAITTATTAVWGLSGSSGSTLTLTLDAINAGAGEGRLILAADDQINLDDGTVNIQFDAGVITETGMVSIDFTPSGTMVMRGGGVSTFGDDTGYFSFDGVGALSETGITNLSLTPTGTLSIRGGGVSDFGDDTGYLTFDGAGGLGETGLLSVSLTPAGAITLTATAASSWTIASDGAADDLTIGVTGATDSSLILSSTGTGTDALQITTSAGAMIITSADLLTATAANGILIDSTGANDFISLDSGTDTSATGVRIRNNTGTVMLQVTADGALTEGLATVDLTPTGTLALRGGGVSTFGDDTGYLSFDGAGTITTSGLVALTLTTSGALSLRGGGASAFGDDTSVWNFDGAGAVSETGITTFSLTPGSTCDIDSVGALTLDSSAAITIGGDAVAQPANFATGDAARVITVGHAASASLTLEAGVGALTVNADTTGTMTFGGLFTVNAGAGFLFDSTGAEDPITFRFGDDLSTSVFTIENNSLNDLLTITADGQHAAYIKDDSTTAWTVNEAGTNYLTIDTSNAGPLVKIGNATTNPQVQLLGTGGATLGGSLTIGADTVLSRGAANRLELAAGDTLRTIGFLETVDDVAAGSARRVGGYLSRLSAPGTAHTNSTDETALANVTIAANTLKAGTTVVVRFKAVVTVNNGATTCTNYLRLTSTSTGLGGTALITGGAVDTDAGFVWVGEYRLNCHAAPGAAASIVGYGSYREIAASPGGTLTAVEMATGTTFATDAALYISMTADWSAADSNSIRAEIFDVEIIG